MQEERGLKRKPSGPLSDARPESLFPILLEVGLFDYLQAVGLSANGELPLTYQAIPSVLGSP